MLRLPTRSLSRWGIILGLFALAWANSLSPYFWGIDDYEWLDIAKSYPAGPYFDPARIRNIDVPERPEARVLLTGRPLVRALFSIEYHLFGESARFYHADNVLLHFLSLLLLFQIARRLLAGGNFAFITACLFAIFPRHAESVTWISGRCDLLMGLFFFLSLYLFLLFLERGLIRYWLISILAGALALLSKETAIALAPVLLYSALCTRHSALGTRHSALLACAPHFGLVFAYILWRLALPEGAYEDIYFGKGFLKLVALSGLNAGHYLANLLIPINYEALLGGLFWKDFTLSAKSLLEIPLGMGIFIAFGVGLLALLAYLFWKGSMLVRFLMVWVIASVALALPIFGERLLYVPSAGFLMVLSYVAHKGLSSAKLSVRTLVAVGLIILLTCYLCSTITKNSNFWRAGRIDYRLAEDVEKALLQSQEVFKEVAIAGVPLELGKWPFVISNFGSRLSQRTLRGKNLTLKFVAPGEDLSLLLNAGVFRESGVLVLSWDGSRLVEPDPLRLITP